MITAQEALQIRQDTKNPNQLAIIKAILNWENKCYVCLGSNLTDEQKQTERQKYIDAGYKIIEEQNYSTFDPFVPVEKRPIITRIQITWE
jgi:hypothetical protein